MTYGDEGRQCTWAPHWVVQPIMGDGHTHTSFFTTRMDIKQATVPRPMLKNACLFFEKKILACFNCSIRVGWWLGGGARGIQAEWRTATHVAFTSCVRAFNVATSLASYFGATHTHAC